MPVPVPVRARAHHVARGDAALQVGFVDERVEEVVQGKRRIADMVLPKSSSLGDLDAEQLRSALGLDQEALLAADPDDIFEDATGGVKQ